MDAQKFHDNVHEIFRLMSECSSAADETTELLGCLTLEEFSLFCALVKEYAFYRS